MFSRQRDQDDRDQPTISQTTKQPTNRASRTEEKKQPKYTHTQTHNAIQTATNEGEVGTGQRRGSARWPRFWLEGSENRRLNGRIEKEIKMCIELDRHPDKFGEEKKKCNSLLCYQRLHRNSAKVKAI